MVHYCKQCNEIVVAEVSIEFVNGEETTWEHCPCCGSDNIIRVDDQFNAAAYAKENR